MAARTYPFVITAQRAYSANRAQESNGGTRRDEQRTLDVRLLVMLEGKNFEGEIQGNRSRVGFVTTRGIEAATPDSIDEPSLFDSIFNELKLNGIDQTSESNIEILKVRLREATDDRQLRGFSFYIQDGWLKRALSKLPFLRRTH